MTDITPDRMKPIEGAQQVAETPQPRGRGPEGPAVPAHRPAGAEAAEQEAGEAPGAGPSAAGENVHALLRQLLSERERILNAQGMSNRERRALLQENRDMVTLVRGGRVVRSEGLVYAILVFSAVVIIAALLGAYLDQGLREVALTITGTVVGGTLTTIAQKLGTI